MLADQVVVVAGASAGIGRATVQAFAREGAHLALLARDAGRLQQTCQEALELGSPRAIAIPTDMGDPEQVEAAAEQIENELGPIDVWVNNAMVTVYSPVKKMTPAEFRRVTEVSYLGAVNGTLCAYRRMETRGHGAIIQVGSALSFRGIPLQSAYCGAKFALRGFTESLRAELVHDGSPIRVAMVHLTAFNTMQFDWGRAHLDKRPQPLPPIFQPEIAARGIVRAASDTATRDLWVGWPAVQMILASRFLPAWILDRIVSRQGYEGQLSGEDIHPDRSDNLFDTVPGDHGAHGRFDHRARDGGWQSLATTPAGWGARLGLVGFAGLLVLALLIYWLV